MNVTRRLLISGLLAAGLTVAGVLAGDFERDPRRGPLERTKAYTDTPLSPDDVRHKTVFDERRNEVGVVRDVVETTRFGPLAIVEVSAALGNVSKKVAVTLDQLILEPDGRLVALLDGDDFRSLPEFKKPDALRS